MGIILASQSPRRRQLLEQMGLRFRVVTAHIDETMDPALPPEAEVARVCGEKTMAVEAGADDVVIGADTIVVADGRILGKPRDEKEAAAMLRLLSGREHQVLTGLSVRKGTQAKTIVETARVRFRELAPREIQAYIASGEPMDKAGAYGVQGLGAVFITGIQGDFYTVMGLPVCRLTGLLRELGVPVLGVGREGSG